MPATWVKVIELPQCDICKERIGAYDGKTTYGPWAYMCEECFEEVGLGLGLGVGQKLILAGPEDH
jgi:hypothetical protein